MACSPTSAAEAGFATPAAAAISLAIAVVAAAVVLRSVALLRAERAAAARLEAEYALEGAQARAAFDLIGSANAGATRWSVEAPDSSFEAVAEPEATKLGLHWKGAAQGDVGSAPPVSTSPVCARSFASPYGMAATAPSPHWAVLNPGLPMARVGQLWRIRVASGSGWVDDRVVRFTGSLRHPIDVLTDNLGRGPKMAAACE